MTHDNTNRFAVWPNDKRRPDKNDAHWTGTLNVNGQEFWINVWKKAADANEKAPSLSGRSGRSRRSRSSRKWHRARLNFQMTFPSETTTYEHSTAHPRGHHPPALRQRLCATPVLAGLAAQAAGPPGVDGVAMKHDDLDPARGIIWGSLLGAIVWTLMIVLIGAIS